MLSLASHACAMLPPSVVSTHQPNFGSNPPTPIPHHHHDIRTHTHKAEFSLSSIGIRLLQEDLFSLTARKCEEIREEKGALGFFSLFPFFSVVTSDLQGSRSSASSSLARFVSHTCLTLRARSSCFKVPLPRLYFPPHTADCQCFAPTSHSLLSGLGSL